MGGRRHRDTTLGQAARGRRRLLRPEYLQLRRGTLPRGPRDREFGRDPGGDGQADGLSNSVGGG